MSFFTIENIGYTCALVAALVAITVAFRLILSKQDEVSKKLRPIAVILIVLAASAATFSAVGMYLSKHVMDKPAYSFHDHIYFAADSGLVPAKDCSCKAVILDTVKK